MKRFLLLLFISMLPLQPVWAAIDLHCQATDVSGAIPCTVNYHATPSNEGKSALESDDEGTSSSDGGDDCTLCHMGHSAAADALRASSASAVPSCSYRKPPAPSFRSKPAG
ncbi:MAG: hypothetical protein H0W40_01100 [Methylibium sp.]|uniref:hypothetical protein n=1 Tax=Methylibium sp. TaxID=2067992 RepID=UPI0018057728|nr:hypothetical protein [Methylibium sp.]MBA3595972.1 hypothetical protein [Methylibium sp.]